MAFKVTIRHGSKVTRERHGSLEDAVEALRLHCERIRTDGGLPEIKAFRDYEPGDRVDARIEISSGGVLRSRDAGVDVMGDGRLIPFRGGAFRKPLPTPDGESPYEVVATAMRKRE